MKNTPLVKLKIKSSVVRALAKNIPLAAAFFGADAGRNVTLAPTPTFADAIDAENPELTQKERNRLCNHGFELYVETVQKATQYSSGSRDIDRVAKKQLYNMSVSGTTPSGKSITRKGSDASYYSYEKDHYAKGLAQQYALMMVHNAFGLSRAPYIGDMGDHNALIANHYMEYAGKAGAIGIAHRYFHQLKQIKSPEAKVRYRTLFKEWGFPNYLLPVCFDGLELFKHDAIGPDKRFILLPQLISMMFWGQRDNLTLSVTDDCASHRLETLERGPKEIVVTSKPYPNSTREHLVAGGAIGVNASDRKKYTWETWHSQDATFAFAIVAERIDSKLGATFDFSDYDNDDPGECLHVERSASSGLMAKSGDKEERKDAYYMFTKNASNIESNPDNPVGPYLKVSKGDTLGDAISETKDSVARDIDNSDAVILYNLFTYAGARFHWPLQTANDDEAVVNWNMNDELSSMTNEKAASLGDGKLAKMVYVWHVAATTLDSQDRIHMGKYNGQGLGSAADALIASSADTQTSFTYRSLAGKKTGGGLITACFNGWCMGSALQTTLPGAYGHVWNERLSGLKASGFNGVQYFKAASTADIDLDTILPGIPGEIARVITSAYADSDDHKKSRRVTAYPVIFYRSEVDNPKNEAQNCDGAAGWKRCKINYGGVTVNDIESVMKEKAFYG